MWVSPKSVAKLQHMVCHKKSDSLKKCKKMHFSPLFSIFLGEQIFFLFWGQIFFLFWGQIHSITLSHKNVSSYLAPLERLYKNVCSLTIFANLFAHVKKKQYLCTLNRARKVYMQMIINY